MDLFSKIKELRKKKGLSESDLAKYGYKSIRKLENGEFNPSFLRAKTIFILSELLGEDLLPLFREYMASRFRRQK